MRLSKISTLIILILVLLLFGSVAGGFWFLAQINLNKSVSQSEAWQILKTKATASYAGYYLGETQTPRLISGKFSGYEKQKTPENIALAFLEDNKDLYRIQNVYSELKLDSLEKNVNFTNVQFIELYKNIPVLDASISVRVTPDSKVESVSSSFVPGINIATLPLINKEKAVIASGEESSSSASLVIYSPEVYNKKGQAELAWKVIGKYQDLIISAETGKLLNSYATVFTADERVIDTSVKTDKLSNSNKVALNFENREIDNNQETTENPGILWMNEQGAVSGLPPGVPDYDAKTAYANLGVTYNYYHDRLGRISWDGKGAKIVLAVHYLSNPKNASWYDKEKRIRLSTGYGDVIDVVAHEFTHGVIYATTQLTYSSETGSINEAFADIFGAFANFYNGGTGWDHHSTSKNVERNLKNPNKYFMPATLSDKYFKSTSDPCSQSNDYCWVHINMSIISRVTQLLVDGNYDFNLNLAVLPLGLTKTEQLFYYLMTKKLGSSSQYTDVRSEAIDSAKSGFIADKGTQYTFTNQEISSVINAFATVGIGTSDKNYNGVPDDQETIGNGISVLVLTPFKNSVNQKGCPSPTNKIDFYALPLVYGNEHILSQEIDYEYEEQNSTLNGIYKGEYIGTSINPFAGELMNSTWYQFELKDLVKLGKVKVWAVFTGENHIPVNSPAVDVDVTKCLKLPESAITALPNGPLVQNNYNLELTPIPTSNLTPTSALTSTPTPIPTPTASPPVNLTFLADERLSGSVATWGQVSSSPVAGELVPGSRAFLSFNLSRIPSNATIQSAQLTIGTPMSYGDPFSLGQLMILHVSYNALNSTAYQASAWPIGTMSSTNTASFDVTNFVRNDLSKGKFQVRLQFAQDSSNNGTTDYLIFPISNMKLSVNYTD